MHSPEERIEFGSDLVFTAVQPHICPETGSVRDSAYPRLEAARQAMLALRFPEADISQALAYGVECAQDVFPLQQQIAIREEWS